ncbi:MAG: SDR family NAD(P)-dependent oxidoreductase [Terriglobia bacterium]
MTHNKRSGSASFRMHPMISTTGEFAGNVAIVTGAGGGLGSAIAFGLIEAGANVVWLGRRKRALMRQLTLLKDGRERSLVIAADVRSEGEVRDAVRATIRHFGKVDILVNNAGARGPTEPLIRVSRRAWQEVLETNLTGPFLFSRECLKHMERRRKGSIVNISSVVGHWAYPLRAPYAASKAGLISLTLSLAEEAGAANVRVNAICPGPVEGKAVEQVLGARAMALGISIEKMRQRFVRPAALGRMVTPEDVRNVVLFLCSKGASNITGQVIDVSAGFGLWPRM